MGSGNYGNHPGMPEAEAVQPWRAEGAGLTTPFREPSDRERGVEGFDTELPELAPN